MRRPPNFARAASIAIVAALVGAVCEGAARADDALDLEWTAPAKCPQREAVAARVATMLGGARAGDAKVKASGSIAMEGKQAKLVLRTETRGSHGERTLSAASCEELGEAAALILALAIDPSRANAKAGTPLDAPAASPPMSTPSSGAPTRAPDDDASSPPNATGSVASDASSSPAPTPSSPAAAPPPIAPATPTTTSSAEPRHARDERRDAMGEHAPSNATAMRERVHLEVAPLVFGEAGTLPSPTIGAAGVASLVVGALRLEAAFEALAANDATLSSSATEGGRFSFFEGDAAACADLSAGAFELAPCARGGVLRLSATGFGATEASSTASTTFALGPAVIAELHMGRRFALRSELGGMFPFARPSFVIDEPTSSVVVHRPGVVSGRAGLGVAVRFF